MSSFLNGRRVFAAFVLAVLAIAAHDYSSKSVRMAEADRPYRDPFLSEKFAGDDNVTRAIRSDSRVLTRVSINSPDDRTSAARMGEIVQDYGSFVIIAKDPEIKAKGYGLQEQTVETTVNLPGGSFDPLRQAPQGSLRLGPAATAPVFNNVPKPRRNGARQGLLCSSVWLHRNGRMAE